MREYRGSEIRNIAVVGHGASGKTSLVDALAFVSGSSKRHGSVKDGTALTDTAAEETERGWTGEALLGGGLRFLAGSRQGFHLGEQVFHAGTRRVASAFRSVRVNRDPLAERLGGVDGHEVSPRYLRTMYSAWDQVKADVLFGSSMKVADLAPAGYTGTPSFLKIILENDPYSIVENEMVKPSGFWPFAAFADATADRGRCAAQARS